jgi:hypothetical protein
MLLEIILRNAHRILVGEPLGKLALAGPKGNRVRGC